MIYLAIVSKSGYNKIKINQRLRGLGGNVNNNNSREATATNGSMNGWQSVTDFLYMHFKQLGLKLPNPKIL